MFIVMIYYCLHSCYWLWIVSIMY